MPKKELTIQLITAALLSLGGMLLLFCGVFIDPQGEIHDSLLIGFGEVATFAGALFGIDYTYKHKYKYANHPSDENEKTGKSRDGEDNNSARTRSAPLPDTGER